MSDNLQETCNDNAEFTTGAIARAAGWAATFIERYVTEHSGGKPLPPSVERICNGLRALAVEAYKGEDALCAHIRSQYNSITLGLCAARALCKAAVELDVSLKQGDVTPDKEDPDKKELSAVNFNRLATMLSKTSDQIVKLGHDRELFPRNMNPFTYKPGGNCYKAQCGFGHVLHAIFRQQPDYRERMKKASIKYTITLAR